MKIPNVIEPTLTLHEENCKREISKHSEQKMELKTRKNHRNYRPVPAEADLGRKKNPKLLTTVQKLWCWCDRERKA